MEKNKFKKVIENYLDSKSQSLDFLESIEIKDRLSRITDLEELISLWRNNFSNSKFQKLIESRIIEVLNEISGMKELILLRKNLFSGSELRDILEDRIIEVLNEISGMKELILLWKNTFSDLKLRDILEFRMIKLVENLSMENIPEWFEKVLEGKLNLPTNVEVSFKKVAGKFLEQL